MHKYTEALFSLADVLIDGNRCLTAIKALKSFKKHSKSFDLLSTKNQNSIYNRIACGYRKLGKLERAKKYIEKVLENSDEKSEGYLNMCAILSNQNDHINALKYAKSAVESIENELNDNNAKEKNTVLGIAYHNIAVEYEHLNKKSISAEFHKKAFNMMKTQENLNLLLRFKSNYEQVNNEAKKSLTRPKSAVTLNLRTKNYLDLKGVRNSKGSLRTTPLRNPFKESANLAFMKKSRTSGTSLKDQLSDFEEDTSSDMKETQREPV